MIRGASGQRAGLVALVLANLFVALQALGHEWGFYEVMLVYWTEVVVLGGYNVLRMLVVGVMGDQPLGAWAARWVDLGSRFNRLGLTAIGVGIFSVKFANFALAIGLFVLLLPALLTPDGERSAVTVRQALAAAGPGVRAAGVGSCSWAPRSPASCPASVRQTLFAGVMVLLKLGADAVSHLVEHHWLAAERPPARDGSVHLMRC